MDVRAEAEGTDVDPLLPPLKQSVIRLNTQKKFPQTFRVSHEAERFKVVMIIQILHNHTSL